MIGWIFAPWQWSGAQPWASNRNYIAVEFNWVNTSLMLKLIKLVLSNGCKIDWQLNTRCKLSAAVMNE